MVKAIVLLCFASWIASSYSYRQIDSIPVLTWSLNSSYAGTKDVRALNRVQPQILEELLMKFVQNLKYQLLVFVDEFLDVEDFSSRNEDGEEYFPKLQDTHRTHSILYFPHVQNPSDALDAVAKKYPPQKFSLIAPVDEDELNSVLQNIIKGNANIITIYLKKGHLPRSTLLQHHDTIINHMCRILEHIRSIMCIYTGLKSLQTHMLEFESLEEEVFLKSPPLSRMGRNVEDDEMLVPLSDFDVPRQSVEGKSGVCEYGCVYDAANSDTSIAIHLAAAPTLWYGDQEYTLTKFKTSLVVINDSFVTLKVDSSDAALSYHFLLLPNNNWLLAGVTLVMNDESVLKRAGLHGKKSDSTHFFEPIFMTSYIPVMARRYRSYHCQLNEFEGNSNETSAKLYLYKMRIDAHFAGDDYPYLREGDNEGKQNCTNGNCTGYSGIDYCIPFANAAVLTAFFISSTMVVLAMCGIAMLMTAKANDRWDTPAQKALLRD